MDREEAVSIIVAKARLHTQQIEELLEYPANEDGCYVKVQYKQPPKPLGHIMSWTQSFFTGIVYWVYKVTGDTEFLKWNYRFYPLYYDKVFKTPEDTMHDLGFLYMPYAVAMYRELGDPNMKKIALKAADELAKRFNPFGGYIRAWGRMDNTIPRYVDSACAKDHFFTKSRGLTIIDSLMNLPLLFWTWQTTGNPFYKKIAVTHANTVLNYFIRKDFSVYHAYYFDETTGKPLEGANFCGLHTYSHWARGSAWAIYGFAIAYRYTGEKVYLETAIRLCKRFLELCGTERIPVWDFALLKNMQDTKGQKGEMDTSAAAIVTCGIFEILRNIEDEELTKAADHMLDILINKYMDTDEEKAGLLKCQNGNRTYTIFGDYFLTEAILTKEYHFKSIW